MDRRGPKDATREYGDRTLAQARLEKDYISGDVRGTLGVIFLAVLVVGLGVMLMWLML